MSVNERLFVCLSFFVAAMKWPLVQGVALRSPHDNRDKPPADPHGPECRRKRVLENGWIDLCNSIG